MVRDIDDVRAELVARFPCVEEVLDTRHILYGNVLDVVPSVCEQCAMTCGLLVADDHTYPLLGSALQAQDNGIVDHYIVPNPVLPTEQSIQSLIEYARSQGADVLVALGSGTINDIVKYASALLGVPYIVFPTAPSMNGYLSRNASIIKEGFRTSVPAQLPWAVLCDDEVLSRAPLRLIKSGVGDSICRATVQVDWYLSHMLKGTAYNTVPFELMAPYEKPLYQCADEHALRDQTRAIMMVLLVGGIGMALCGGSYPASQGEHMWAHCLEMMGVESGSYHGEEIAVTSWYMAQIQRRILHKCQMPSVEVVPDTYVRQQLSELFPSPVVEQCLEAYRNKQGGYLEVDWSACREKALQYLGSFQAWDSLYRRLGLPRSPESIGWTRKQCEQALSIARFTRDRFTILDFYSAQEFLLDERIGHH